MQIHKLGKRPPVIDPRTFQLSRYLPKDKVILPPVGVEQSWITRVPNWPMFLNDTLGDCVIAAMGHMIQQWTYYATGGAGMVTLTDNDILRGYEDVGNYVPGNPSTDNGASMLDALNYWRKNGLAGHKILAYMAVDPSNELEIEQAIQLFGNLFTGLALPLSAQGLDAWTVPDGGAFNNGQPGSWGGHCVPIMASSPITRTCITWAERLKMSHNFFADYVDELYVVLSQEWIELSGLSASGFNLVQLQADLTAL